MGCGDSSFSEEYGDDNSSENQLNEQKSEYENLPNTMMINGEKIDKYFSCDKVLGSGGSCRVLKAKKKSDTSLYATKELVRYDQWNPMLFAQEIEILSALSGNENVLSYKESYINETHFYLCTQLCIGVIPYVLLSGRPPFWGRNNLEILTKIIKSEIHWPSGIILSKSCKSFICELLEKDPRKRLSAKLRSFTTSYNS